MLYEDAIWLHDMAPTSGCSRSRLTLMCTYTTHSDRALQSLQQVQQHIQTGCIMGAHHQDLASMALMRALSASGTSLTETVEPWSSNSEHATLCCTSGRVFPQSWRFSSLFLLCLTADLLDLGSSKALPWLRWCSSSFPPASFLHVSKRAADWDSTGDVHQLLQATTPQIASEMILAAHSVP